MEVLLRLLAALSILQCGTAVSKVLELSDRFLELRGESTWLVMFYAPWCGHCKKLEPIWNHVAYALYGTEIRVGRVDCTRFTAVATEFVVKGFPTIMYVQGDTRHTFIGDRTKEDIVGFAVRMAAAPVQRLAGHHQLAPLTQRPQHLFFIYVGTEEGHLWDLFKGYAERMRAFHYFYSIDAECMAENFKLESVPTVMVFKDDLHFFYPMPEEWEVAENQSVVNATLGEWLNHERFHTFTKITHGNLSQLWKIKKFLAITVVKENKIGSITTDENTFRDMVKAVIIENRDKYHKYFQFGWTGTPDLANSIAMERLPLPSLLVVNATTMHHHLPDDPPHHLTPQAIQLFLDSIIATSAPVYGGDSWPVRIYRMYYTSRTTLEDMWQGNPVLTAVIFGLPLGFLSLICYSIWCSDILDADEDEEHHEKKE